MSLAVDFSQYGGSLAPSTVVCWKAAGIEKAIVQYSSWTLQQLETLAAEDMPAEMYVYLYWGLSPWGQTPQDRTRIALGMCKRFGLRRLWLDAEDSEKPYQESQLVECVRICREAGIEPGIYTGRWWWIPRTGNSQAFAHLPLWHAQYISEAPGTNVNLRVDFDTFEPYGGWTRPEIWQIQNTSTLCGHSVDLNQIEADAPMPPVPSPIPDTGDPDMMIVHNSRAAWFEGRQLDAGGPYEMHTLTDLDLPSTAKMVRLDVYLDAGAITFRHGNGLIAGVMLPGSNHQEIDVLLEAGKCVFEAPEPVTVRLVGALGYWQ